MKVADIRAMTVDQLDDEVLKLKKEKVNLRFQRATGQLENTARVRVVRRDIARILTIAAQKRAGAPMPQGKPARTPKPKTAKAEAATEAKTEAKAEAKPKTKARPKAKAAAKSKK